ncbi:hypothetical protein MXAN_5409 [Myxococcus xanthus DK 1622]|uniref:Uncharacterized protein n=1 Tax=Myxococcus xanthus (strain DK1622) TaxID=246197 RepID=Q1D1B7_MYXXD|nr:hypothetical protein MXAN_5409 [Myxococcus xanthus DK 1622]
MADAAPSSRNFFTALSFFGFSSSDFLSREMASSFRPPRSPRPGCRGCCRPRGRGARSPRTASPRRRQRPCESYMR